MVLLYFSVLTSGNILFHMLLIVLIHSSSVIIKKDFSALELITR